MNLATRCTACGTMFRVVQDQLKVSEGWVRCGRCEAVFNAQERLFDLEHDTPPPWQPPEIPAEPDEQIPAGEQDPASGAYAGADDTDPLLESAALLTDPPAWGAPTANTVNAPVDADGAAISHGDAHDDAPQTPTIEASASAVPEQAAVDDALGADVTPEFLRRAQRKERWQRPAMRWLLGALIVASALLLAAQVVHHHRQAIAAQHPGAMPWLERFCAIARCRIGSLQRIADVSIETTALTQAAETAIAAGEAASAPAGEAHVMRLAITLRNRGEWPIAMPDVDLSLTGSDGELVARRALSPHDFGVTEAQLLPGQDLPLSLRFRVASGRVSGYTVEVFYP